MYEGQTVNIVCFSNRQVSWKFNGNNLPSNVKIDNLKSFSIDNRLHIYNANLENSGIYTCSVKYMGDTKFVDSATVEVRRK